MEIKSSPDGIYKTQKCQAPFLVQKAAQEPQLHASLEPLQDTNDKLCCVPGNGNFKNKVKILGWQMMKIIDKVNLRDVWKTERVIQMRESDRKFQKGTNRTSATLGMLTHIS